MRRHDGALPPEKQKEIHEAVSASIGAAHATAKQLRDAAVAHRIEAEAAKRNGSYVEADNHLQAAAWAAKQAGAINALAQATANALTSAVTTGAINALAQAAHAADATNQAVSDSTHAANDAGVGTTQPDPNSLPPVDTDPLRAACRAQGGVWDGATCTMPSAPPSAPPPPPASSSGSILPFVLGGGALLVGAPVVAAAAIAVGAWALTKKAVAASGAGTSGLAGWSVDASGHDVLDVAGLQTVISMAEDAEGDGFLPYCQDTDGKYGDETRANLIAALQRSQARGGLDKNYDIEGNIPDVQSDYSMDPVSVLETWVGALIALAAQKMAGGYNADTFSHMVNSVEYVCTAPKPHSGGKGSKGGKDKGGGLFPMALTPSKGTTTKVIVAALIIGGVAYYVTKNHKPTTKKAA